MKNVSLWVIIFFKVERIVLEVENYERVIVILNVRYENIVLIYRKIVIVEEKLWIIVYGF